MGWSLLLWFTLGLVEESSQGPKKYIGQRFPATNIPEPVRCLYLGQPIRVIASVSHPSSKVRIGKSASAYTLRSASTSTYWFKSMYIEGSISDSLRGNALFLYRFFFFFSSHTFQKYLRNMGVSASCSISLRVRENNNNSHRLWGLIICHHNSDKLPPIQVRQELELLSQVFQMQYYYLSALKGSLTSIGTSPTTPRWELQCGTTVKDNQF